MNGFNEILTAGRDGRLEANGGFAFGERRRGPTWWNRVKSKSRDRRPNGKQRG